MPTDWLTDRHTAFRKFRIEIYQSMSISGSRVYVTTEQVANRCICCIFTCNISLTPWWIDSLAFKMYITGIRHSVANNLIHKINCRLFFSLHTFSEWKAFGCRQRSVQFASLLLFAMWLRFPCIWCYSNHGNDGSYPNGLKWVFTIDLQFKSRPVLVLLRDVTIFNAT